MSQISRLHNAEIANGNLIDATHLNDEFNQLVSESNSHDGRLTSAESTLTNHTSSFKNFIYGLVVEYSTANRVLIKPGSCRDSTNTDYMEVTSNITVDISVSGINGLDLASETASTWYYVWLIKNTSTGVVAGLFSASNSTPAMPTGYNKKRLLPIAIRNDGSSNFIRFSVSEGWPTRPFIRYNVTYTDNSATPVLGSTNVLNSGTSATFVSLASLPNFVPAIAREVEFNANIFNGAGTFFVTEDDALNNGVLCGSGAAVFGSRFRITTSSGQLAKYKRTSASNALFLDVAGFIVTEV